MLFIEAKNFTKAKNDLISKTKLLEEDYIQLKRELAENPFIGAVIPGTNGIRKIRLKSASQGKSGGFRICYYYLMLGSEIYLLLLYAKNVQENLTQEQKKILKGFVNELKKK